jgi:hypothetical protein
MCAPLIAVVAIAAVSAFAAAKTQKAQAEYQGKVAANNAKAAEWQAEDAIQRGNAAADNVRRRGGQTAGSQRAAMAAAGLDIGTGSALSILEDTDYFNQLDQNTVRDNAAREAWGYKVQGSNAQATAQMYQSTANGINPLFEGVKGGAGAYYAGGGNFGAGKNSLLNSGTAVNPKWYSGSVNGSAGNSYIPSNVG